MRSVHDMPTSLDAAAKILGDKDFRTIANNTWLRRIDPHTIQLGLHGTAILEWHEAHALDVHGNNTLRRTVRIHTGGWQTVTTKARLNAALPAGFRITQRNHRWFMCVRAARFDDGSVKWDEYDYEDGDTWDLDDVDKG